MSEKLVVFVCTGNVCRSPMAEYLMKQRLGNSHGWKVVSAGTCALGNEPPTQAAVFVMAEKGIDISKHRSLRLEQKLVDKARVIVAMTRNHAKSIKALYPHVDEKTFLIGRFDPKDTSDIEDPIGMSTEDYRRTRDRIDRALDGLVSFLKSLDKECF